MMYHPPLQAQVERRTKWIETHHHVSIELGKVERTTLT